MWLFHSKTTLAKGTSLLISPYACQKLCSNATTVVVGGAGSLLHVKNCSNASIVIISGAGLQHLNIYMSTVNILSLNHFTIPHHRYRQHHQHHLYHQHHQHQQNHLYHHLHRHHRRHPHRHKQQQKRNRNHHRPPFIAVATFL
jgi:hypothetical protein